jgi:hypothetical protein
MPDRPIYPEFDRDPESGDPRYVFRPRMMGAEVEYRLTREGLEMRSFARKLVAPYREIRKIRLSFRPQSLSMRRCLAEIWTEKSGKLILTSNSWKSMVEQDQLDGPYLGFLAELHRRLHAAGAKTQFHRGQSAFVYWVGIILFTLTLLAFAALVVRGLRESAWGAVAMVGAMMALFFWQLGQFLARNRPGTYKADELPMDVLPKLPKLPDRPAA